MNSSITWRRHSDEGSPLPMPFISVLIYKGGEDGAYLGVFAGYRPDDASWMAHNLIIGELPIEPGDWWMEYPEAPEG